MIKYPISNRDLLRSVMVKIEAAHVVFDNPNLRQFQLDEEAGLCTLKIVKDPEIKETVEIMDLDGNTSLVETTRQQHHVEVHYHDPEIEMLRKLAI